MPGAGLNASFLREGANSADTVGWGVNGNVSSILPSVTQWYDSKRWQQHSEAMKFEGDFCRGWGAGSSRMIGRAARPIQTKA